MEYKSNMLTGGVALRGHLKEKIVQIGLVLPLVICWSLNESSVNCLAKISTLIETGRQQKYRTLEANTGRTSVRLMVNYFPLLTNFGVV